MMASTLIFSGCAVAAIFVFLVLFFIYRLFFTFKKPRKAVPRGTVLVHQFHPWRTTVNPSPPCLKLETFLRMATIPYENDYRIIWSPKGKMPWIEYNGQFVSDSNFCIRFLSKEFGVDVDEHLSDTQKAISHCILTMIEENTYWAGLYFRWMVNKRAAFMREKILGKFPLPLKYLLFWRQRYLYRHYLYGQGMGRHTEEEIVSIFERDIRAVAQILGDKEFLFGKKPCVADAAVFGLLANLYWADLDENESVADAESEVMEKRFSQLKVDHELVNLKKHTERMKELYFPDWDDICSGKVKRQ